MLTGFHGFFVFFAIGVVPGVPGVIVEWMQWYTPVLKRRMQEESLCEYLQHLREAQPIVHFATPRAITTRRARAQCTGQPRSGKPYTNRDLVRVKVVTHSAAEEFAVTSSGQNASNYGLQQAASPSCTSPRAGASSPWTLPEGATTASLTDRL
jgi:hypothetical protein